MGRITRAEKVHPSAVEIDQFKCFPGHLIRRKVFMKDCLQIVFFGYLFEDIHDEVVVVGSNVCTFINWSHFELGWSHFVMSCFDGYSKFDELQFGFHDHVENPWFNCSEIVVIKLLAFLRTFAKHCFCAKHKSGLKTASASSMRKNSCSGPQLTSTYFVSSPRSFKACVAFLLTDLTDLKRGVFKSSASPYMKRKYGMVSVLPFSVSIKNIGEEASHIVYPLASKVSLDHQTGMRCVRLFGLVLYRETSLLQRHLCRSQKRHHVFLVEPVCG